MVRGFPAVHWESTPGPQVSPALGQAQGSMHSTASRSPRVWHSCYSQKAKAEGKDKMEGSHVSHTPPLAHLSWDGEQVPRAAGFQPLICSLHSWAGLDGAEVIQSGEPQATWGPSSSPRRTGSEDSVGYGSEERTGTQGSLGQQ